MRVVKRNGSNAVQLLFGTEAAHNKPQGFSYFTVNWSATSGKNAPAVDKAFIRLEWLDGNLNPVLISGHDHEDIVVRPANWETLYRNLENAQ